MSRTGVIPRFPERLSQEAKIYWTLSEEMTKLYEESAKQEDDAATDRLAKRADETAKRLLAMDRLPLGLRSQAMTMLSTCVDHPNRVALAFEARRILDEDIRKEILDDGDDFERCFPHGLFNVTEKNLEAAKQDAGETSAGGHAVVEALEVAQDEEAKKEKLLHHG